MANTSEARESVVKARYVKLVVINSINDIDKIESRVNGAVETLKLQGGKIVSILPIGFGLSPMNLLYNIIYESEKPIEG